MYGVEVDDYSSYHATYLGEFFNIGQPLFEAFLLLLSNCCSYNNARLVIGLLSIMFFFFSLLRRGRLNFFLFLLLVWYAESLFVIHLRMGLALSFLYFLSYKRRINLQNIWLGLIHYSTLILFLTQFLRKGSIKMVFLLGLSLVYLNDYIFLTDFSVVYGLDNYRPYIYYFFIISLLFTFVREYLLIIFFLTIWLVKFYTVGELSARLSSSMILLFPLLLSTDNRFGLKYMRE